MNDDDFMDFDEKLYALIQGYLNVELNDDQKTTINEIILETISKNFDIDINDFDYEIKGTII